MTAFLQLADPACKPHTAEQLPCRVLSDRLAGPEVFEHQVLLPELSFDVFACPLEGHAVRLQSMHQEHGWKIREEVELFLCGVVSVGEL